MIQLLHPFNGLSPGVQDLGSAENARLVRDGLAVFGRAPVESEQPQRVFTLGDSLDMRRFRAISAGSVTVLSATDVEVALGTNSALPPPGSMVRVINQADTELNRDVEVVGSGTNSTVLRFPFTITGRVAASLNGAAYAVLNDTGYINYAEAELAALGYPIQIVRNAGDGGDTLAQIRARIATEIAPLARPGDIVVFMGGVNGAGTSGEGSLNESTAAAVIEQLGLIIDELLALGVTVCASTITQAQASGYWSTSPATAIANTKAANGYLRARAKAEARLHVFDSYAALGGGDYAASDVKAGDIHLLVSGAEKIGQRLVDDCIGVFRKGTFRRVLSAQDNYAGTGWNLLANPDFTGASGSTAPTGWTLSAGGGTNTFTLAARADGVGNDLTIDKAHTAATSVIISEDITSKVAAGQRLVFGVEQETVTVGQGHYWYAMLQFVVGGVTYTYRIGNNQDSYANGGRLPPAGVRRFFEHYGARNRDGREGLLVPEGFTSAVFSLHLQLGASGSCQIMVSRPQVYRVG